MLIDAIKSLLGTGRATATGVPASTTPAGADASSDDPASEGASAVDPVHLAACVLLLDVAHADGAFTADERAHLEATIGRHFALPPADVHALIIEAERERGQAIDHFRYTNTLRQNFDVGQKMVLAEVMWGLVLADGTVDEHEHYLTRKISNLLELEVGYLSTAKARAAEAHGGRFT